MNCLDSSEESLCTELKQARALALRRLNRREYSSGEVAKILKEKNFGSEVISTVIDELIEKNYLNDERYSKILIREQILRGKGPRWIQMKLTEKGIKLDPSTLEAFLQETANLSEIEMTQTLLLRRYPDAAKDPNVRRKAIQALLRRGFTYSTVLRALSVLKNSMEI